MLLPGRELLRGGCMGTYLKPFGMRLLAAAASELVMRQFLSTCSGHLYQQLAAQAFPSGCENHMPLQAHVQSKTRAQRQHCSTFRVC